MHLPMVVGPPLLVLVLYGCAPVPRAQDCPYFGPGAMAERDLPAILVRGGFSASIDASASFRLVGCHRRGGVELGVFYYAREFGSRRLTQRLVMLSSRDGYLGMYAVNDAPARMEGNRILFPFPADEGNVLVLENGAPPSRVWLDGEVLELFR